MISLLKTPVQRCLNVLLSNTNSSRKNFRKVTLAFVLFSFSFNSYSQSISIGSPVNGMEGSTFVSFVISLDNGVNTTGAPITGSIVYTGTASVGADYTPPTSFSIPVGVNSTLIILPVLDDALIECDETVIATIATVNVGTINPAGSTSSAIIVDDECAQTIIISIGSPVDAVEGSSNVTFDVFIEGGAINTTGISIDGTIAYPGSSAMVNVDFVPEYSFSIPSGANSTTITLTVIDDFSTEPTETVIPTLTGTPTIGSYGTTSVTALIFDDDASNLSISIGSPIDGEEGVSDASFVVSLDFGAVNGTGSDIYGSITFSGTANSSDFSTGSAIFTIPDGQATDTIQLLVIDDFLIECDETVIATISNPNVGIIGTASSTATIIDNECGLSSISIMNPVDGEEGVSNVTFVVAFDNGWSNGTGAAVTGSLTYSGTATSGLDFTDVPMFSIPDGASFVEVTVPVDDDLIQEPAESVIATIASVSIGLIGVSVDTAYIIDNDSTSGFEEINFNAGKVEFYPNPTSSVLNLSSNQVMKSYSIIDLNGRELSVGTLNTEETVINVRDLPTGFYIIKVIMSDGNTVKKKILKE